MHNILLEINVWLHRILGTMFKDVVATVFTILLLTISYHILSFFINRQSLSDKKKYNSMMRLRNTFFIIFLLIELFIWSGEIKTLFFSAAAIMAAMIVTFKEIILCFVGSFLVSSNKLFVLGDYIEYDNIKGKVVDRNFLYTKILIGESFHAKELNVPNAIFINNKVTNISRFGKYQNYEIKIAIDKIYKMKEYEKFFEEILSKIFENVKENYIEYFKEKKSHDVFFDIPNNYYDIVYDITEIQKAFLKISFLAHPTEYKNIENQLINSYLKKLTEQEKEK